ncbi:hypothetical protein [Burkholderia ambifaria]
MFEFKVSVALNGAPFFETEWMESKAHTLEVVHELAERFEPDAVHVTLRKMSRLGYAFYQRSAAEFITEFVTE